MAADEPGRRDDDATSLQPPAADGDATAVVPPAGADATAAMPGQPPPPDATSVMPAVGAGGWSARAEVPQYVRPAAEEPAWGGVDREPRRWWIAAVLVAVFLLAVLGWGGWLLLRDDRTPAVPQPSASAPAVRRTTAAPTTSAPRPSRTAPATTAAPRVTVPDVVGEDRADAQLRLDAAGLAYRLDYRATDEAPSGEVLEMSPDGGARVAPDTVVLLVVAESPAPPTEEPEESAEPESS
ncbi:hypothetical protein GCM10010124_29480 [Pilimelia terevasa]|uniref:PASTA domain-containing protein n=1 Tax=Pilimelia terevasa TaxID=53372 RepID=A0A8J3FKT9_9ACTN|nr:PASTA domain-containing protein [Pilimelia terevasa]GGK34923.1 hypothetical protein GCM10010124_29480 [Pilimelia terevasa]